ncbi:GNAT family N-acyltransferase [Lysobacter sp. F6437]|uniref:GNAT family N-acyltransferase n=1 Tax=Lysobacter sp. F6437 TaxID=3459296 RepID=UPI00403DF827
MLQLEARLQSSVRARFPHWFRGRRRYLAAPLLRTVGRWSRLDLLDGFIRASGHLHGFAFVEAALEFLQACYRVDPLELRRIPASGRLLIVANHPSGALDALALLDAVGKVRSDVRIVANDLLCALDGLSELLLPVTVLGGRSNVDGLRAIEAALDAGQCVIVFPAGEVARLGWRGVADGRWRRGFLQFARRSGAPVLPVRIVARNSALFYGVSAVFKPIGTALLAREMFARRTRRIELRIGRPQQLPGDGDAEQLVRQVRGELLALGTRREEPRVPSPPGPGRADTLPAESAEPLVPAVAVAALRSDIESLALLGQTGDGKQIRAGRLAVGASLLREIGRLRELTFRAVGEGTGRRLDVDLYDGWYEHIVLWDAPAGKVAGAYRVARGAEVLAVRGLSGLYTASLFHYADDAITRLAAGMELGRSFVTPEYWGGRSIDYLWQGIGAYLARHPNVRYLYGPVSISAALPTAAREQIVAYYARYHGDAGQVATPRQPFVYQPAPPELDALDANTAFRVLKANLDALGAAVPMLYKQYTELCEPGGARFLAFGVDPAFSDAVDGLIELDLQQVRPRKRERYLGSPATPQSAALEPAA